LSDGEEGVGVTLSFYSILLVASILLGIYIYSLGAFSWALESASLLLGAALASYFYARALWNVLGKLRVTRVIEGEAVEGTPLGVKLEVSNPTLMPIMYVEAIDIPPKLFRVIDSSKRVLALPPRSGTSYSYRVIPIPGKHLFGPVWLKARDPLGLAIASLKLDVGTREVHVLPRVRETPMLRRLAANLPYMGVMARRRGWGTAFYYLREYTEEDDYRRIDWKSYARTGRLLVKVFEAEEALRVALVVILSKGMLYGPYGNTMFEVALRVAASLAYYHLLKGDVVEIFIYDGDGSVITGKPLWGRFTAPQAWRLLASASPPNGRAPSEEDAVEFLRRILPSAMRSSGYYLILVTSLEGLAEALSRGRATTLLSKALGGAFIHLYTPLFSAKPSQSLEWEISYRKALLEVSDRMGPLLERIGFSYVAVGPETRVSAILRRLGAYVPS